MNCLIIGYGSIGQRHARILQNLDFGVAVVSQREIPDQLTYSSLTNALSQENPEYIILANETYKHYESICKLADYGYGGTLLVEKPLFHLVKEIPKYTFKQAYVGYNLRFHPILQKLFDLIKNENVLYCQIYVGQYLPDWRPKNDYRKSYSAKRNEGGGVLLDLSHELDYLLWFFKEWESLVATGGKYSSLDIDSADMYSLMVTTKKCPMVQIHLNYLDRISRREITIITENDTIIANLVQQTLQINSRTIHFQVDRDDTYILQHHAIMNGTKADLCTLTDGLKVLELIENAEQSAKYGKWMYR
jgi:predicted dehydrogenase